MKRYMWLAVAAAMAGGIGLCPAQELAKTEALDPAAGEEVAPEAAPWNIAASVIYKNWLYEHDALQQRVPASSDLADAWEQGDTDGSGAGAQVRIGRGDGHLNVTYMKSDFDYRLVTREMRHEIATTANDFELSWSQIRGRDSQAEWGSTLGFRYLGMQKDVTVTEGKTSTDGSGNVNWLMLLGGYDGNWRPFETPTFQMHGFVHFFLGEADGTARGGTDENWSDGVVSETYGDEYSLAYGARALFGIDIGITKRLRLVIDYMREWLYSFDATDTGTVVFPDNSDALFIENHHAIVMQLGYLF